MLQSNLCKKSQIVMKINTAQSGSREGLLGTGGGSFCGIGGGVLLVGRGTCSDWVSLRGGMGGMGGEVGVVVWLSVGAWLSVGVWLSLGVWFLE